MKQPIFDAKGHDKETFAPFELSKPLDPKWPDTTLAFSGWDWFKSKYGTDTIDDYYINGYGVQGLVQSALFTAGMNLNDEGIHFDSEGDTCFLLFRDLDTAARSAELASDMINDPEKLRAMIKVAREQGFED